MSDQGRIERILERIASGIEKLNEDPTLYVEGGPPCCPHCETINPEITVQEDTGEGPFSQYLIQPTCGNCGNSFFAVPMEWAAFSTYEEAQQELDRRAEVFGRV